MTLIAANPLEDQAYMLRGLPEGSGYLYQAQSDRDQLWLQFSTGAVTTEARLDYSPPPASAYDFLLHLAEFIATTRDEHIAKLERPAWHDDASPLETPWP